MPVCPSCGWWERICHCKDLEIFSLAKDKLFEFNTLHNGKVYQISSKKGWKKFMKERNLNDDVSKNDLNPYIDKKIAPSNIQRDFEKNIRKALSEKAMYSRSRGWELR